MNAPAPQGLPEPRRLTHCRSCGYALDGLPDEGTCPECGASYDQTAYILYGFGRGRHATLETSNSSGAIMHGAALLLILAILLPQLLRPHRLDMIDYAIYGGILFAIVLMVVKRLTADRPGLVQVWLTPQGFGQTDDLAPGSFVNTLFAFAPPLLWLAVLAAALLDAGQRSRALEIFGICIFVILFNRHLAGRFFWSAPPTGAPRLTPWSKVRSMTVTLEQDDRYRIRIDPIRSFWSTPLDGVDAAITCTPELAHRLTSDTTRWRNDARPAESA